MGVNFDNIFQKKPLLGDSVLRLWRYCLDIFWRILKRFDAALRVGSISGKIHLPANTNFSAFWDLPKEHTGENHIANTTLDIGDGATKGKA